MRYPILQHTLKGIKLIDKNLCNTIIDVGAQRETRFLMEIFPESFHHLFEPVSIYHQDLQDNYDRLNISYKLHKLALSDVNKIMYLHNTSGDATGIITHSYILEEPNPETEHLVNIKEIPSMTLDTVMKNEEYLDYEYIVKMDVDGLEEKIINGGSKFLEKASFIIIEASLGKRNLFSRSALIESLGYRLFDIADNAYYFGQMSQVDLVFINEHVRNSNVKFRPWEYAEWKVIWSNWQHGFPDLEGADFADPYKNTDHQ